MYNVQRSILENVSYRIVSYHSEVGTRPRDKRVHTELRMMMMMKNDIDR
jgi:hypothetical protein